ncbi:enoyl-CoA hydratase/isomerase family protein [Peptoniphilus porci]|uniref:3-hydroxyisobutyryl-CoA hydrolase n=1 Tax=Peptoniphilus porci TaxID=2652280 RepID=A0A1U7M2E2_9FIRM|nr:enoyl-CoA hydratase/isomerase family protein [Peptoniphilus porci]OLR65778.1 enoyl-CoA hydratase [Peptoniphilus porci]
MVIEKVIKNVGVIYLNRPEKINALNLEMINKIQEILERWESDENIRVVLFDTLTKKGFCSGGDLKELYIDYINNDECKVKNKFFATEFEMDKYIASYKKPVVSHWTGIVMGGGIGLSINSDLIISDESVIWAMPETSLGFVPDVGVCSFISTLPQALGQYVGLTGSSLESSDLVNYGLADLYINSRNYTKLVEKLFEFSEIYSGKELIKKLKIEGRKYKLEPRETSVTKSLEKIEKYFSEESVVEIYKILENNLDEDFARKTYEILKERSQLMLAVQFEKYFVCKNLSYHETVDLDLKVLNYSVEIGEMQEGARAKVIDKGSKPNWSTKSIEDVNMDEVKKLLGLEKTYSERKNS